jgi:hypothetical protein
MATAPNISLQRTAPCGLAAELKSLGAGMTLLAIVLLGGACSSTPVSAGAKARAVQIQAAEEFLKGADIRVIRPAQYPSADGAGSVALCASSVQDQRLRTVLLRLFQNARKNALTPLPPDTVEGGVPGCVSNDYVLRLTFGGRTESLVLNMTCGQYMNGEGWAGDIAMGETWRELAQIFYSMGVC